jgi:hypothetical protein
MQPVTYCFTHESTKAEVTVQYLNEVFDACQNAGLKVVATVCDMGAIMIKALKPLHDTKRKLFFRFHNEEITTVYDDPPHLLKCTHNLFLKHDVQLKSEHVGNQLPVIAKWDHILKLYEFHEPRPFRQLHKLTDTHHNPTAHSAMNVSLAGQVMDSRPDCYCCHTVAGC